MSKKNQKENDEKIKTENTDKEAVNEEKSDENAVKEAEITADETEIKSSETEKSAEQQPSDEKTEVSAAETADALENAEKPENAEAADAEEEKKPSLIKTIKDFILGINYPDIIMTAIGSYFMIMAYFIHKMKEKTPPVLNWQEFVKKIPTVKMALLIAACFILISVIHSMLKKKTNISAFALLAGALSFSIEYLWKCENYYYCVGFVLVSAIAAWFCYNYGGFKFMSLLPKKAGYAIVVLFTVFMGAFIGFLTVCRHIIGWTATYDFGLFLQMYDYMADCFEPLTTCERDGLLSHFAVHFSPIYYLILPFYYIFPHANTLLISQAVLAVIGAIPLMLICREKKFSNLETVCFSIVFLFCCAIVGPCFYDFHENAFLPPLLMWLFYAIEKRKTVLMYVFMVLVLLVKEDAALYIMLIGLYCTFNLEKKYHGLFMFAFSGIYFVVVTSLMTKYGEGVMTSRTYGNLMIDQEAGLGEVIKNVVLNPAYFITQCISEDSMKFVLIMLLPLAFMPLVSKKLSRYFLVVPFLLMNLASGYYYAKDTGFQYVFGTSTCLIYCALLNYEEIKAKKKQFVPVFMSVATLCSFATMLGGRTDIYKIYKEGKERYQRRDSLLEVIPEEASVSVFDSFLLTQLAQRDEIYLLSDAYLNKPIETDFVVISNGYSDEWLQQEIQIIEQNGYSTYGARNDQMTIYVSPDYKGGK